MNASVTPTSIVCWTAALTSAAPEFQNLGGSHYPVLQEGKIVFRESFHLRDIGGEGGEVFLEELVNVRGIPTPHLRGFCTVFAFSSQTQLSVYLNVMKKKR